MKASNLLKVCGVAAALMLSAGSLCAQPGGGGGGGFGGGGGGGGFGGGGGGGGGGFGGGAGGGGRGRNFDPAQMQQMIMDTIREQLVFTNDTDWNAVQPLVQKVVDARTAVGTAGMGMLGRRGGRGGGGGFGGGGGGNNMFNQPNPDRDALQQALADNAPAAQVKALLQRYQASQKAKQTALVSAQANLRTVLTVQQEAQATLLGLLD
jgi:hypothetical protein